MTIAAFCLYQELLSFLDPLWLFTYVQAFGMKEFRRRDNPDQKVVYIIKRGISCVEWIKLFYMLYCASWILPHSVCCILSTVHARNGGLWRRWNEDDCPGVDIQLWCDGIHQGHRLRPGTFLLTDLIVTSFLLEILCSLLFYVITDCRRHRWCLQDCRLFEGLRWENHPWAWSSSRYQHQDYRLPRPWWLEIGTWLILSFSFQDTDADIS